jgi:hypothetical protein
LDISRRGLLLAAVAVPSLYAARQVASSISDATRAAVRAARPTASGTSASRCAQCGAPDHTMLDPRCPLAPRVLA